jgi:hypothetical protein
MPQQLGEGGACFACVRDPKSRLGKNSLFTHNPSAKTCAKSLSGLGKIGSPTTNACRVDAS